MSETKVNLLFPHQLFHNHEIINNGLPTYLLEEYLFFKEFSFHKQKLAFHRASMKSYENYLIGKGVKVIYVESINQQSDVRILLKELAEKGLKEINIINPTDNWLEKRIKECCETYNIQKSEFENPLFLNTREDLKEFFKPSKKSFFQTTFYKQQRVKRDLLLEFNQQPKGGKWSFDVENRKKYPKGKTPPSIHYPDSDKIWLDAVAYVQNNYSKNLGELDAAKRYPTTFSEVEAWLKQFLEYRFHQFGDFEDAIVKEETILNHSVLSPLLNVGLITPDIVIQKANEYAEDNGVPLNSLEGFIRQLIGWREFIRGMYEAKGSESRTKNFWGYKRKIPSSFYEGTTGIIPIDNTIQKVLKSGYCHHIERLMVLGNFMMLCEFDPKEVYRWFMELFIDAYDWVMVPNVYGMSQFADGGLFATKPYISGSNYIMKMSNYKKGEWQQYWDGLFWRFMDVNRDFFLKNPRLGMLVRTYDKMDESKQRMHHDNAAKFLNGLDNVKM